MTKWTRYDVFLTICTVLFSTVLAQLVAGFYTNYTDTPHYLDVLVLVPLTCSALLAWFLKKRGRRLRFFAGLLAGFDVLLLAGAHHFNVTLKIVRTLTGYNNGEAVAFIVMIPLLCCGLGMLPGIGLGALLARLGRRTQ